MYLCKNITVDSYPSGIKKGKKWLKNRICERQNIKETFYKKVAKSRNNTYRIKKIDIRNQCICKHIDKHVHTSTNPYLYTYVSTYIHIDTYICMYVSTHKYSYR